MPKITTRVEYTEEDIHLTTKDGVRGDPMHDALLSAAMMAVVYITLSGKPKDGEDKDEAAMRSFRSAIAAMLTSLEGNGYVLSPRESIPDVLRRAYEGGVIGTDR